MTELVRHRQRPHRANRVHEEGVRAVEAVDEAGAVRELRPARRLHRAADLEREFVKVLLPVVLRDAALAHQAQQVAVGRDVVEPVVVHADVRDMRRHVPPRALAPDVEEPLVTRGIELKNCRAKLKALRPLRPATRGVFALHREDRRAVLGLPRLLDDEDFLRRKPEKAGDFREELLRGELGIDLYRHGEKRADTAAKADLIEDRINMTVIVYPARTKRRRGLPCTV